MAMRCHREERRKYPHFIVFNICLNFVSRPFSSFLTLFPPITHSSLLYSFLPEQEEESEDKGRFVPEPVPVECLPGVLQALDDVQNLGLITDVDILIPSIQSDNFRPLPGLKRQFLVFETLQRPKDEI